MTSSLTIPFRRIWRLAEAHWALATGAPERALDPLRDPLLAGSERADELRERAVERLCARAAMRASEGRDGSVLRLLSLVEVESAGRARDWRSRLVRRAEQPAEGTEVLAALLETVRAVEPGGSDDATTDRDDSPSAPDEAPAAAAGAARDRSPGHRPVRFQMAVDDGGEFLVVSGERISLGHSSAGVADIPVLADIESIHVHFTWGESFHAGPGWKIEPGAKAEVSIGEARIREAHPLCHGDLVQVAPHLSFRFWLPEPASASALLELLGGAEAEGAVRVLLVAQGPAGRVRIGPQRKRHVPVAGLEYDVSLSLREAGLEIACEGGVRLSTTPASSGGDLSCSIPLPLAGRVEVIANARPSRRIPFGIALHPLP